MWVAWWRLNGRDLREGEPRAHFVDRLRSDPRLTAVISRLSGTGATGGIGAKALSDVRALAIVAGGGIFVLLVVMGPMFTAMVDSLAGIVSAMPEALLAMVGFADYSTAQGWYHGEGLSVTGPIAIAVVTISAGLGLVREERNRTIGLLHTAPISRAAVAWRKAGAMVVLAGLMGVLIFAGLSLGNLIAGLSMDYGNIAAASVLSAGLGCVLGAVAFAVGAVWGRTSVALGVAISVALLGWGINSFVAVNASLEPFARVSPFYYYSNNFPLVNGMDWGHALVLFAAAAVLVAIGVFGYQRRDLRG
jgi:ABC-2 type transport system permease protein